MNLWFVVMFLALLGLSLLAYALEILDAPGAVASFVLGFIIIWTGGLPMLALMAVFTGIAFVTTRLGRERKRSLGLLDGADGERSVANVVGNGAAPGAMALCLLFMDPAAATTAFAAAVAAIAADTMGSEVGSLSDRSRSILPPFRPRPAGENGAVSLLGQVATTVGAAVVAACAFLLLDLSLVQAGIAFVAGFLGGQLDSVLGATMERDYMRNDRPLGKQDVNFLASFVPSVVVLLTMQLL